MLGLGPLHYTIHSKVLIGVDLPTHATAFTQQGAKVLFPEVLLLAKLAVP